MSRCYLNKSQFICHIKRWRLSWQVTLADNSADHFCTGCHVTGVYSVSASAGKITSQFQEKIRNFVVSYFTKFTFWFLMSHLNIWPCRVSHTSWQARRGHWGPLMNLQLLFMEAQILNWQLKVIASCFTVLTSREGVWELSVYNYLRYIDVLSIQIV